MHRSRRVAPLTPPQTSPHSSHIVVGDNAPHHDDHLPPEIYHLTNIFSKLERWHHKLNLPRVNEVFAGIYLITGLFILIVTLATHPENNLRGTFRSCQNGYCYIRHMTGDPKRPAYSHLYSDAFHPYDWSPLLAGIILITNSGLIFAKITLMAVNLGHFMNFISCLFCMNACVRGFMHTEYPMNLHFQSPAWAEGIVHTFFDPFLYLGITVTTVIEAALNATSLVVVNTNHYSEMYLSCQGPPAFYDAATGKLKSDKHKGEGRDDDEESTLNTQKMSQMKDCSEQNSHQL